VLTFGGIRAALRQILRQTEAPVHHERGAEEQSDGQTPHILVAELRLPSEEIERRTANDERNYRVAHRAFWVGACALIVSFITMVSVIVYAIIAGHQRDAMRDQVTEMREANRLTREAQEQLKGVVAAENRAWLDLQRIEQMSWSDARRLRAKAVLRNAGRAPAVMAVAVVGIRVLERIPGNKAALQANFRSYQLGTVLPGMDPMVPLESETTIDRPTEDRIWNAKTLYLVVSGFIMYTDRFGSSGSTPICQYYDNAVGGFVTCGLNVSPQ